MNGERAFGVVKNANLSVRLFVNKPLARIALGERRQCLLIFGTAVAKFYKDVRKDHLGVQIQLRLNAHSSD